MNQAEIRDFLERFFTSSDCTVLSPKNDPHFKVKLTKQMDKLLMNRPFYWHYIEQTRQKAETAVLAFKFDDRTEDGELIHFGSPRLHQIFHVTEELGRYIRLYQIIPYQQSSALEPWIGINMKVSYQCDLKKERLTSIGLQLINGTLIEGFQTMLTRLRLNQKLPDYCYTLKPLITIQSGIRRIEQYIESEINAESSKWAEEAKKRWEKDQSLLDSFYEHRAEKPERYDLEKQALEAQYKPYIHIQLINAGLFYLNSATFLPNTVKTR
ncbi:YqhG family protein [Sporolactobacillus sp. CPB3-1]|uniref:YqhG family protein n=1 Tax=Sporolactobacillus mangiferae TaxID=2940498 RepID=A0ABT0MCG3_9BACL|nr:YqhG family protein [Sporolactobacillus mangiferae]MCL1632547.1 YqhG family protein [Sporolactobacillus mangiferae]